MSKSTWTGGAGSWDDADNWSPAGVPGAGSDVTIATGDAVASASIGTVNSITDSSDLSFESAGTNTVTTFLDNTGRLHVDAKGGEGGTILNIGGTLTNSHRLTIGNATLSAPDEVTAASLDNTGRIYLHGSSANQALLDVTAGSAGFGAAGVLSGTVGLAGDSAIEFGSGEITTLANGAHLGLVGSDAFIEDSTAPGSNSALTGLASIGYHATLDLENGASVTTTTTGAFVNHGTIDLDTNAGDRGSSLTLTAALHNEGSIDLDTNAGDGGSSLTLTGALNNRRNLTIGNSTLSASDEVTAAALHNEGSIDLIGSNTKQALLDVTGTAGVLSGDVSLVGDSAIEFASGQITSLSLDGSALLLDGKDAFIEDSTALGSNSALTGLASISGGGLDLENGASVSTSGALVSDEGFSLDAYYGDVGGSSLTVGGALSGGLEIGNATLSASDKVTAESFTGSIVLNGSSANQALLDVTGSAGFGVAGVARYVHLTGDSAVEFGSGQITSLSGVEGSLLLDGKDAFIEDSTALGSNSALTGLASIGAGTELDLENGASVSTTGALANDGELYLVGYFNAGSGTSLTVGGTLTNAGAISLTGNGTNFAALTVSGTTTNNGSISIASDTETLAGAVGGTGSFSLSNANLQFDSSVSFGQTIKETGKDDALILEQAQNFAGTISGFGTGDTIDATNFHAPPATTYNFVENPAHTGGMLTLHDASLTAKIHLTGDYSNKSFTLAHDSGTGTLVKFA